MQVVLITISKFPVLHGQAQKDALLKSPATEKPLQPAHMSYTNQTGDALHASPFDNVSLTSAAVTKTGWGWLL
jgi:hypothetical protein